MGNQGKAPKQYYQSAFKFNIQVKNDEVIEPEYCPKSTSWKPSIGKSLNRIFKKHSMLLDHTNYSYHPCEQLSSTMISSRILILLLNQIKHRCVICMPLIQMMICKQDTINIMMLTLH